METWLGIDGTNWVHALWHALENRDVLTHFACRAEILAKHVGASNVLICFDRRSFRHDIYAGYKANRASQAESLRQLLQQAPGAVPVTVGNVVYQDGFEADDLLATLAAVAIAAGRKCVLASPDKDLWQCLREGTVRVIRHFKTYGSEVVDLREQT